LELLSDCLEAASGLGYRQLAVSGGEPLLYGPLPELLARARELGMLTTVTTNGMLLTPRRWDPLAALVDVLAVSIDGTQEEHDLIRRRDGAFAYQLAVVVDDADSRVSNVVRGADLLASTAWQIELQKALNLAVPRYAQLPLIVEEAHGKLAKSRRSLALDPARAGSQLVSALMLLQHPPPAELQQASPATLLAWATERWALDTVQGKKEIVISTQKSQV